MQGCQSDRCYVVRFVHRPLLARACFCPIWVLVRPAACCVRDVSWRSLMLMLMICHTTRLTTLRPRWWGLWPRGEGRGCVPDEAGKEGSGSRTIAYV